MKNASVAILLSTYNGALYLDAFLGSLEKQEWRDWHVQVRDDGSTDDTVAILRRWMKRIRLTLTVGRPVGVTASFLELLKNSGDCDIAMFADQDDVWHADKVVRAVSALTRMPNHEAAMYCARARIVDQDLSPLGLTPDWPRPPSFENALVENIAIGCTIALNRPAIRLVTGVPSPSHARLHDGWCYLVVAALGTVLFDSEPSVDYRQHGFNTVGTEAHLWRRLKSKIIRQLGSYSVNAVFDQALDFHVRYADRLDEERLRKLNDFLSLRPSQFHPQALFSRTFQRQHRTDDIVLRLRLALPGLWRSLPSSTNPARTVGGNGTLDHRT